MSEEAKAVAAVESIANTVEGTGTFRFQGKNLLLTYKTHIPKAQLTDFIRSILERMNNGLEEIIIAHESGEDDPKTPYLHTHVYIKFQKKPDITGTRSKSDPDGPIGRGSRTFDYMYPDDQTVIHPHWRVLNTTAHANNARRYLGKEDPENAHLKSLDAAKVDLQLSEATQIYRDTRSLTQAVSASSKKISDVIPTITYLKLQKREEFERSQQVDYTPDTQIDWSLQWWFLPLKNHLVDRPMDYRKIYWFYSEHQGNLCKSAFQERFEVIESCKDQVYRSNGSVNPASYAKLMYDWSVDNGQPPKYVFINYPLAAENNMIYTVLEQMKDGLMTGGKYEGANLRFKFRPHVVVFSNFVPNLSSTAPSIMADRFIVRCLNTDSVETLTQRLYLEPEHIDKVLVLPSPQSRNDARWCGPSDSKEYSYKCQVMATLHSQNKILYVGNGGGSE